MITSSLVTSYLRDNKKELLLETFDNFGQYIPPADTYDRAVYKYTYNTIDDFKNFIDPICSSTLQLGSNASWIIEILDMLRDNPCAAHVKKIIFTRGHMIYISIENTGYDNTTYLLYDYNTISTIICEKMIYVPKPLSKFELAALTTLFGMFIIGGYKLIADHMPEK